ncbi:MAG: YciE/YciF ferroxidase family protein [Phycisphaerales bacterium]
MPMNIDSLKKLYIHSLKDLYHAENQILEALPKMEKAAHSDDLKKGFREHHEQTKLHVKRLEAIFQGLGSSPNGVKCEAILGLIKEGNEAIDEIDDGEVRDAGLIAAAQKVEHYEIASYGTVRTYAQMLGEDEASELLTQTLDEESATDQKLTDLAMSGINQAAAH